MAYYLVRARELRLLTVALSQETSDGVQQLLIRLIRILAYGEPGAARERVSEMYFRDIPRRMLTESRHERLRRK